MIRADVSAGGEVAFHVRKGGVQRGIEGLVVHRMAVQRGDSWIRDGDGGGGICRAVQGGRVIPGMTFVDVLWRGQVGCRSSEAVGKIDAESGLGGLRRDLFASVALNEQAHELLALLLIFRQEVDGFSVGGMPMHGVARAHDMDLSEREERQNGVDDGRDGGKGEGGD